MQPTFIEIRNEICKICKIWDIRRIGVVNQYI